MFVGATFPLMVAGYWLFVAAVQREAWHLPRWLAAELLLGFVPVALALAAFDTWFYRRYYALAPEPGAWLGLIWTPWNHLRYNMVRDNLTLHGLHPPWLHVLVNGPILFGPLWGALWQVFASGGAKTPAATPNAVPAVRWLRRRRLWLRRGLWLAVLLPLAVLSAAPHQEPRFLMPLLLPVVLLTLQVPVPWAPWLLFNALACVFFGWLHQGGVVPMLEHMAHKLQNTSSPRAESLHVFTMFTYPLPLHLLTLPETDRARVVVHPWEGEVTRWAVAELMRPYVTQHIPVPCAEIEDTALSVILFLPGSAPIRPQDVPLDLMGWLPGWHLSMEAPPPRSWESLRVAVLEKRVTAAPVILSNGSSSGMCLAPKALVKHHPRHA
jgi:hypothetical protein